MYLLGSDISDSTDTIFFDSRGLMIIFSDSKDLNQVLKKPGTA